MRHFVIALIALAASTDVALCQQASPPGSIKAEEPEVGSTAESCVEVDIGGSKALDCINRKLKKDAERVSPLPNIPPADARTQDIHLGIINSPAVQQQYGPNFGKSVVPFRPPAPVYTSPLGGH